MPYKVGDLVWVASCDWRALPEPCPVCFGKLKVTVILGDGRPQEIVCKYCGDIMRGPTGVVYENYDYAPEAKQQSIDEIRTTSTAGVSKTEYFNRFCAGGLSTIREDCIFGSRLEALDYAQSLAIECTARTRLEAKKQQALKKANNLESLTWNIGYHKGIIAGHLKDMEYHQKQLCIYQEQKERTP
jgi:hypothetical protein